MMNRRTFLCGLTLGTLIAPLFGEGQPTRTPRIGYLGNGSPPAVLSELPFNRGLRELGWIEGQNVTVEYRWAGADRSRLPTLVTELVNLKVDVIVLAGPQAIAAAQETTRTAPVVFVYLGDPVTAGFVSSLARPGGNMTGVASEFEALITKQVQLLKEAVPGLTRIVLLRHRDGSPAILAAAETAARSSALAARTVTVAEVGALGNAFRAARDEHAGAIHVLPSPILNANRRRVIELAAKYRLPAIYELKSYVEDGGLMSYGPDIDEMYRHAASYVDRLLKGAKPGELPIERPTTFELVINLKTAKALGLTIPPSVLGRADQVIE